MKAVKDRAHLEGIAKAGEFLIEKGSIVATQKVSQVYRETKDLSVNVNEMSKSLFEKMCRHLPICQVYINGRAYLIEDRLTDIVEVTEKIFLETSSSDKILQILEEKIGSTYKDALSFLDTYRDRNILKGLIAKLTSVRLATKPERKSSRYAVRNCLNSLEGNISSFNEIVRNSRVVET